MDMNRPTLLQDKFCTMVYKRGGGVVGDVSPLLLRGDPLPLTTILNILGVPTNKDLHPAPLVHKGLGAISGPNLKKREFFFFLVFIMRAHYRASKYPDKSARFSYRFSGIQNSTP